MRLQAVRPHIREEALCDAFHLSSEQAVAAVSEQVGGERDVRPAHDHGLAACAKFVRNPQRMLGLADIRGDADEIGISVEVEQLCDLVAKLRIDPFRRHGCDGRDGLEGFISYPPIEASNAFSGLTSSLSVS
ncbi:hypothetical protein [Breoghania sp.]|uniref:hypothetical protein n=1 Tax=Breoghania sp. TaxID=2065378 RepID=UPI00261CC686|nr:hypothetical protein [Breoghania sp.]MDJ0933067.1 hypothetical protein [Breoghania sp.]